MIAVERVLETALDQKMSLAEFLASPESGDRYEFVDGQVVKKDYHISVERLPSDVGNKMCPVPTELAIEIMSEGQTFREFVTKAGDYLSAGVLRVWVIDPLSRTLTIFYPDRAPETFRGDRILTDELFPDLAVTVEQFFVKARI